LSTGNIHDDSSALLSHDLDRMFRHEHVAGQVYRYEAFPEITPVLVCRGIRFRWLNSGVVYQYIERAQALRRPSDSGFAV
jgi:hypothetical protein